MTPRHFFLLYYFYFCSVNYAILSLFYRFVLGEFFTREISYREEKGVPLFPSFSLCFSENKKYHLVKYYFLFSVVISTITANSVWHDWFMTVWTSSKVWLFFFPSWTFCVCSCFWPSSFWLCHFYPSLFRYRYISFLFFFIVTIRLYKYFLHLSTSCRQYFWYRNIFGIIVSHFSWLIRDRCLFGLLVS